MVKSTLTTRSGVLELAWDPHTLLTKPLSYVPVLEKIVAVPSCMNYLYSLSIHVAEWTSKLLMSNYFVKSFEISSVLQHLRINKQQRCTIFDWGYTAAERNALQRAINKAQRIIGCTLPALMDIITPSVARAPLPSWGDAAVSGPGSSELHLFCSCSRIEGTLILFCVFHMKLQ